MKVAFIGLGVMGGPMAGHLAAAGHDLAVFNRTRSKAEAWRTTHVGRLAESPSDAVSNCDFVALCVGADDDVREIMGEVLPALKAGATVADHTTTSASLAREMALQATRGGSRFLDAPVSGGQAGAETGRLSIMVGGDAAAAAFAGPVMGAYAKAVRYMGPSGNGQLTKMVNQICIAGVVQGLAEAVGFAHQSGLDPTSVYDAISQGAAQSWQMDNRWATMANGKFDFGFAVDLMRKDLGLVLQEARMNGARLEVTALVDQFYSEVQGMGGRRWDTSSLAARLVRNQSSVSSPGGGLPLGQNRK
jgi:3-hydroxyisobutyrate dehydrogenase